MGNLKNKTTQTSPNTMRSYIALALAASATAILLNNKDDATKQLGDLAKNFDDADAGEFAKNFDEADADKAAEFAKNWDGDFDEDDWEASDSDKSGKGDRKGGDKEKGDRKGGDEEKGDDAEKGDRKGDDAEKGDRKGGDKPDAEKLAQGWWEESDDESD